MNLSRKQIFWRVFWGVLTAHMLFCFYQLSLPVQAPERCLLVKNKIDYLEINRHKSQYYSTPKRVLIGIWQDTKKWDEVPVTVHTFYTTKINDHVFFDAKKDRIQEVLDKGMLNFGINIIPLFVSVVFWVAWIVFSINWCYLKITDEDFKKPYLKYMVD